MQPYFFPYIGYYQLVSAVESFIFLDDVNYIKKGYINRNSIFLQGRRKDFSIPVAKISQNKKIVDHEYVGDYVDFLKIVEQAYSKSPFYKEVMPLVSDVIYGGNLNVAQKNASSIMCVFKYLGLERNFLFASQLGVGHEQKGEDRILEICEKLNIKQYRNAIGGLQLYDPDRFREKGIELKFVRSRAGEYSQSKGNVFEKNLSIIDVLMNCEKEMVISMLREYCYE